jgi:mRNA interferase RelE/StbE
MDLKKRVAEIIESVEQTQDLREIGNLKELRGSDRYYRIRMGDYRIGVALEAETVVFVRFLHRKDVYRYFPLTRTWAACVGFERTLTDNPQARLQSIASAR